MKETVSLSRFRDGFREVGRTDSFSYKGLELLYNFRLDIECSSGYEIEYDPIALCVQFIEFKSFEDFKENCDNSYKSLEDLAENTVVISNNMDPEEISIIEAF